MRNLHLLDQYRRLDRDILRHYGGPGDHECGAFQVPSPIDGQPMMIVASALGGWDHVSVSRRNRCPNWPEIDHVKRMFFRDDETAMQLHVPAVDHISDHPYCLHLWRPHKESIPRPPFWMVGGCSQQEAERLAKEAGVA